VFRSVGFEMSKNVKYGEKVASLIDDIVKILDEAVIKIPNMDACLLIFPNGKVLNKTSSKENGEFFTMRDKNNQLYLCCHELVFGDEDKLYISSVVGYDILTEEELQKSDKKASECMLVSVETPGGTKLTQLGNLYLVQNSKILVGINGKKFGHNPKLCLGDEYPDGIISMLKTEQHSRGRGLAKNLINYEEILVSTLNRGNNNCLILGQIKSLEPVNINQNNDMIEQFYRHLGYDVFRKTYEIQFPNRHKMQQEGRFFKKNLSLCKTKNESIQENFKA